jgi:N-acetylneuraminate synthase
MPQEAPTIRIGDRLIGEGEAVYFIAEIGINHNGNPEMARQLIDVAASSGADAVKFQRRDLASQYSQDTLNNLAEGDKELQFLIPFIQQAELSEPDFRRLAEYAGSRHIEFLCTAWDETTADYLAELGLRGLKVASADLTNDLLLEHLAGLGLPLILSTGMSTWAEIEHAVALLREREAEFALLHCQSSYPAAFPDLNLRRMARLREFGVPVGYSGHERGIAISTAAVALGAVILERHVTLDRTLPGPDHAASLEPGGLTRQIRDIRNLERALGRPAPGLSRGEVINRHALRKSLAAARDIAAGETLTLEMLTTRGPGSGVSPQRYREVLGTPLPRAVPEGEQFRESDFTDLTPTAVTRNFPRPWGCVARYRDCAEVAAWGPQLLEFHLTDYDLDHGELPAAQFPLRLALHAPEYYHGKLLDLCALDEPTRRHSLEVIRRSLETARALRAACFPAHEGPVLVIVHPGGMSYEVPQSNPVELEARLAESMQELRDEPGVEVLLENMPPFPWYFGGQWYHNIFVEPEGVAEFVRTLGLRLTFDLSHAQLYCNRADRDILSFIRLVRPYIAHLHLADSSGTDAEALQFGEGMTDLPAVMRELEGLDAVIIPEIWMGHLHHGEGFLLALQKLKAAIEAG